MVLTLKLSDLLSERDKLMTLLVASFVLETTCGPHLSAELLWHSV